MRTLQLRIPEGDQPVYLRIAQAIRDAILGGRLKAGENTPSTRGLAAMLGVHRNTVIAALAELMAEGWLLSEPRSGYRVSADPPSKYALSRTGKERARAPAVKPFAWQIARDVRLEQYESGAHVRYAFHWGLPDLSRFPLREFRSHVVDTLRRPKASLFDYGSPMGHPLLLEVLEQYLRRMRGIEGRSVFVTHGSGEGLWLLAHLLLKSGDCVAMEDPGYAPARELFRILGAKVLNIPVGRHGLDVERFERLAARHRIKLLFITPLHQFPSTVTLPMPHRLRLYEAASRHGVAIFEDDYDHEFHYRAQPLPPLASQDPDGRVLYAGTFSKVLFPSARIGFVAIPRALEAPLVQLRRLSTHQNDAILQVAMAQWMASGGLERHLRRMRRHYHAQRDTLVSALGNVRAAGAPIDWQVPEGGMALWLDTHQDSRAFAQRALKRGVFVSGEHLYRRPGAVAGTHVRLGFSSPSETEIRDGIAALFRGDC